MGAVSSWWLLHDTNSQNLYKWYKPTNLMHRKRWHYTLMALHFSTDILNQDIVPAVQLPVTLTTQTYPCTILRCVVDLFLCMMMFAYILKTELEHWRNMFLHIRKIKLDLTSPLTGGYIIAALPCILSHKWDFTDFVKID